MAAYVLAEVTTLGVPWVALVRILGNLILDVTVGSIPLVGDMLDTAWKANARNAQLLGARCGDTSLAAAAADRRFLVAVVAAATLLPAVFGAAAMLAASWPLRQAGLL